MVLHVLKNKLFIALVAILAISSLTVLVSCDDNGENK